MAEKFGKWALALVLVVESLVSFGSPVQAKPLMQVAWRFRIDEHIPLAYKPIEGAAPAVTSDGRWVFAGGLDGVLYKVDAISGKAYYKLQLDGALSAQPLLLGAGLVVCTEEGSIYYLSQTDLHPLWDQFVKFAGVVRHQPQPMDGQSLALVDDRGVLTVLSTVNGAILSTYSEQSFSERSLTPITVAGRPQPLFDEGSLFAGFDSGVLIRWSLKGSSESAGAEEEDTEADVAPGSVPGFPGLQRDWEANLCSEGALSKRLDGPRGRVLSPPSLPRCRYLAGLDRVGPFGWLLLPRPYAVEPRERRCHLGSACPWPLPPAAPWRLRCFCRCRWRHSVCPAERRQWSSG